ncbi:glycerol-3-phosphate dehydrogenase [NAD(P)+] [Holospora obtusa F1]|uniref:Glycerol-3-phosphate dehydrogenase [NAD(P)+] n=1 Tax=Holospora obtusa F1 TaxID=1399147 RepID=W6TV54_HOLOB|nr:NAD(P)H-dependent glycerol-3-phosphate dehydrogenase [Holospora obtusa]ETZ07657.1 glycerol-3-phosphate dehydrogenase [NAD(P)+] [Holospora obtusa F1]
MSKGVTFWGAGRFSSALASCVNFKDSNVFMWGREKTFFLPDGVKKFFVSVEEAAQSGDIWIFCIPSQALRSCFLRIKESTSVVPRIIVLSCKGIEEKTGDLMTEISEFFFPSSVQVVFGGPNFAEDLIKNNISGMTIATHCLKSFDEIFSIFSKSCLLIEHFDFPHILSAWGALKNVAAIGCGLLSQVSSSKNTQSTYLCKIFSQSIRWIVSHILNDGQDGAWTYGGIGDFFMTCTSKASRNFLYGKNFCCDSSLEPDQLVEGLKSLQGILIRNERYKLELRFAQNIKQILEEKPHKSSWLSRLVY